MTAVGSPGWRVTRTSGGPHAWDGGYATRNGVVAYPGHAIYNRFS